MAVSRLKLKEEQGPAWGYGGHHVCLLCLRAGRCHAETVCPSSLATTVPVRKLSSDGWAFGAAVTTLLGTPTCRIHVPGLQSQLHFCLQLLADVQPEAALDGSNSWVPATHEGEPGGVLAPAFGLGHTRLLWAFGE